MSKFPKDCRVAWSYTHHFNRKSRATRVKHGTFIRDIRMPEFYKTANQRGMGYPIWSLVHFDGNKNPSRVMRSELERI